LNKEVIEEILKPKIEEWKNIVEEVDMKNIINKYEDYSENLTVKR